MNCIDGVGGLSYNCGACEIVTGSRDGECNTGSFIECFDISYIELCFNNSIKTKSSTNYLINVIGETVIYLIMCIVGGEYKVGFNGIVSLSPPEYRDYTLAQGSGGSTVLLRS